MDEHLQVPAICQISDTNVRGQIVITYEGRAIPTRFFDRVKLAFSIMFNMVPSIYKAETLIFGCVVTTDQSQAAIQIG